ncbi:hypothetical protein BD413DRAFT_184195 [Trametes elegans]|nr:hypothetical protein BD413DRAFT_184195 [Trametes elegans]
MRRPCSGLQLLAVAKPDFNRQMSMHKPSCCALNAECMRRIVEYHVAQKKQGLADSRSTLLFNASWLRPLSSGTGYRSAELACALGKFAEMELAAQKLQEELGCDRVDTTALERVAELELFLSEIQRKSVWLRTDTKRAKAAGQTLARSTKKSSMWRIRCTRPVT